MRYFYIILLFVVFSVSGQQNVDVSFISKEKRSIQNIVGIDNFGDLISFENNIIRIDRKLGSVEFADVPLGYITSANAFNPLKINLFYMDFNTVRILDNRLNEIYRVNFNDIQPYRNVTYISTGHDNTIWVYNQDLQQLELFDYKQGISRVKTLPISGTVLDLTSNYNFSWILTEEYIISYNYFGSMVSKIKNNGYTSLIEINDNVILKQENGLFFLNSESRKISPIDLPELLIKAFFATDETLYIYDGEFLHQYQLKTS